jgi:hypothetical protein
MMMSRLAAGSSLSMASADQSLETCKDGVESPSSSSRRSRKRKKNSNWRSAEEEELSSLYVCVHAAAAAVGMARGK